MDEKYVSKIYMCMSCDKKLYLMEINDISVYGDRLKLGVESLDLYNHGCFIMSIKNRPMITWYDAFRDIETVSNQVPYGWIGIGE